MPRLAPSCVGLIVPLTSTNIVPIVEDIDPAGMSDGLQPATTLAQQPLELAVGSIAGGMLRLDGLADRRPHHVKMLIACACNVQVAAIPEVLLDDVHDLVLRKANPVLHRVSQGKRRA